MEDKGSVLIPKTDGASQTVSKPTIADKPLIKPISSKKLTKSTIIMIISSLIVVIFGIGTGWFLAGKGKVISSGTTPTQQAASKNALEEAGLGDEKSYGSTTEGILKKGGIKGEGTHYIDRNLGESKYVYLTSSVVDLESFVDKKVVVWGETISAKYASWMIDVGKIKTVK